MLTRHSDSDLTVKFLTESLKPVHKSIWSDSLVNQSVFKLFFRWTELVSDFCFVLLSVISVCMCACVFDVLQISCMLGNLQCTYPWSIYHLSVSSPWIKTHYSSKRSGHCLRKNSSAVMQMEGNLCIMEGVYQSRSILQCLYIAVPNNYSICSHCCVLYTI